MRVGATAIGWQESWVSSCKSSGGTSSNSVEQYLLPHQASTADRTRRLPAEHPALLCLGRHRQADGFGIGRLYLISLRNELELLGITNLEVDGPLLPTHRHGLRGRIELDDVAYERNLPGARRAGHPTFLCFRRRRLLGHADRHAAALFQFYRQRFDVLRFNLIANLQL